MSYCDNCGEAARFCGCTWDEQAKAHQIKEAERRRKLAKAGRPVVVDNLKRRPC